MSMDTSGDEVKKLRPNRALGQLITRQVEQQTPKVKDAMLSHFLTWSGGVELLTVINKVFFLDVPDHFLAGLDKLQAC